MPRLALDISNNNGTVTDATAKASGAQMLIAKATEGTTFDDQTLAAHRQTADRLGLAFGLYIFLHAAAAGNEAEHLLAYAKPRKTDVIIIDAEGGGQDGRTLAQMARRTNSCAVELEKHGHHPLLYASSSYWLGLVNEAPELRRLRVWEAQYPGRFTRWSPTLLALRARLRHGAHVSLWQWTQWYALDGRQFDMSLMFDTAEQMVQPLKGTL